MEYFSLQDSSQKLTQNFERLTHEAEVSASKVQLCNYVSKVKDKKGCHFLCQNVQNKTLSFWLVDVFWGAKIAGFTTR